MVAISEAMATALQAYQVGNLVIAEWTCQQVLEQRPHYVPALHLLGAIAHQTGRLESAIAHYQTVIALEPTHAEAHGNLAVALYDRRNQEQGDWAAAANYFQRSLALNPRHAPTHFNAGNLALKQQQFGQAIAHYQQAIALKPHYAKAYNNLGHALREQGNLEAAIAQYRQAIALTPNDAQAHNNLGNALQVQEQFEAAIASYQRSLALQPDNAEVLFNLGNALRLMEQVEAAIVYYRQALTLKPDWAAVHNNLALCLQEQQQFEAAIAQFQQAVALEPDADAYNNLGVALYELNDVAGAIEQCQRAIDLKPAFAEAHLNLSMALLAAGDYQRGFSEYEWRWEAQDLQRPPLPGTVWDGSALEGRTLLLYTEQGFGDAMQFIRYVPFLVEHGRILIQCPSELIRLFATLPEVQVISHGSPLPAFDVHLPLMSLPYVLNTSLATIPNQVPYLSVPEACRSSTELSLHPNSTGTDRPLNIGIVQNSVSLNHPRQRKTYRNRTASLSAFMSALYPLNVELYSLQVGAHAADLSEYGVQHRLHNWSPQLQDFADTAAAIAQLDLIITVDTAVAHLAGALAKPVWVVLPFAGDWRWLLNRDDSPWYPTMRLFRQEAPGDWESAMLKVVQALRERIDHEHST